jgi:steroid delta-isomerase-like uncharacterized protein
MTGEQTLVRAFVDEAWSTADATRAGTFVAEDARVHVPPFPDGEGVAPLLTPMTVLRDAMADLTVSVDLLFGSGPRVAVHFTAAGTHTGSPLFDAPASGRTLNSSGVAFFTVQGNRITAAEGLIDGAGLMQQLYGQG